jgi:hypothetical protein
MVTSRYPGVWKPPSAPHRWPSLEHPHRDASGVLKLNRLSRTAFTGMSSDPVNKNIRTSVLHTMITAARLDSLVETALIPEYTRGGRRAGNPAYQMVQEAIACARQRADRAAQPPTRCAGGCGARLSRPDRQPRARADVLSTCWPPPTTQPRAVRPQGPRPPAHQDLDQRASQPRPEHGGRQLHESLSYAATRPRLAPGPREIRLGSITCSDSW